MKQREREIKFRAFDTKEKRMITPIIVIGNHSSLLAHYGGVKKMTQISSFVDLSNELKLMQYTGLKDKNNNGQDTYHSDILKIESGCCGDIFEDGGNFVIEWVDDGWAMVDKNGEYFCSLFEAIYNRAGKVIGNIMENPELLK